MACILKKRFICRKSNLLQVRAPEPPILHANPFGRCIPPQLPALLACDEARTARIGGGATEARMKMLIRNEIACVLCGTQNQLESQAMQTCYRTDVASRSVPK